MDSPITCKMPVTDERSNDGPHVSMKRQCRRVHDADMRETHEVSLELGPINVEGNVETEGGGGVRDKITRAMRRFKLV